MPGLKSPSGFNWDKPKKIKKETQLFHFLNNLHQTLKQRFSWYNFYHSLPNVSFLNLGILILSFVLFFAYTFPYISITLSPQGRVAGVSWFNQNWNYRTPITIDHTKVDADLTDFPVLINSTNSDWADVNHGGYVAQSNGNDILFTDSNGVKLSHEIEEYDNTTGKLVAWVKIPTLSSSVDTTIYMYYGNASAPNQQNPSDVWSNGYVGVWHLGETSDIFYDSKGNYNGTASNITYAQLGKIGKAAEWNGNNSRINVGDVTQLNSVSEFSLSFWMNQDVLDEYDFIFSKRLDSSNYIIVETNTDGYFKIWIENGGGTNRGYFDYSVVVNAGEWEKVAIIYNGSAATNSEKIKVYINGQLQNLVFAGTIPSALADLSTATTDIGFSTASTTRSFDGRFDEFTLSSVIRSAEWISTEYNNQNSPSTFYSLGSGEMFTEDWYNYDWQYRKKITIDHTKVFADLTDFPIVINLDSDVDLASHAQTNANDILFTDSTGINKLSHEIEEYDNTTGKLVAWVKIPTLSSSVDTTIYMYYGNASAPNQQNPTDVWSNGYIGVWHMKEENGTVIYDSTGENHGTVNTATNETVTDESFISDFDNWVDLRHREIRLDTEVVTSSDGSVVFSKGIDYEMDYAEGRIKVLSTGSMIDATSYLVDYTYDNTGPILGESGPIGNAIRFDAFDYITTDKASIFQTGEFSLSCWVSPEAKSFVAINAKTAKFQTPNVNGVLLVSMTDQDGSYHERYEVGMPMEKWSYVAGTYDHLTLKVFRDGLLRSESGEFSNSVKDPDITQSTIIGQKAYTSSYKYGGTLDEVRISNVARSAEWIATEYKNQSDPFSFYSIGLAELGDGSSPTNPTVFTAYNSSSKTIQLDSGNWYSYDQPYFEWLGAQDFESGVAGYYVYWGTDPNADPLTAGTYQTHRENQESVQNYTVVSNLTLGETYYLRLRTKNNAGLFSDPQTFFTYKFDNQPPDPPEYINVSPLGCSTTSTFTFTWPEVSDAHSGFAGFEYKLGSQGTVQWAGNVTELEASPYQEGDNVLYIRSKDNVGNTSSWQTAIFCSTGVAQIIDGPYVTAGPSSITVSWISSL